MAVYKGSLGVVSIGGSSVGELTSWSFEESADTIDTSSMGDTARTFVPSLTTFSGSMEGHFDWDDAGQSAATIGATAAVIFYPEGEGAGVKTYTGSVIITGVSASSSFDGVVSTSISFQGTGSLTASA